MRVISIHHRRRRRHRLISHFCTSVPLSTPLYYFTINHHTSPRILLLAICSATHLPYIITCWLLLHQCHPFALLYIFNRSFTQILTRLLVYKTPLQTLSSSPSLSHTSSHFDFFIPHPTPSQNYNGFLHFHLYAAAFGMSHCRFLRSPLPEQQLVQSRTPGG